MSEPLTKEQIAEWDEYLALPEEQRTYSWVERDVRKHRATIAARDAEIADLTARLGVSQNETKAWQKKARALSDVPTY